MDILDIIEEQYFKKIKTQKIINNSLNNEKDNVKLNNYFVDNEIKNNPFYFF